MRIRQKLEEAGGFKPAEIEMLVRVFEATCPKSRISGTSARRIIVQYQAGVRDEAELTELARKPLGH